jgi:presenilin-like A22 family membrane protease
MDKKIKLYSNWSDLLKKAWSIRFIALAGILTGAEVILPMFENDIPRNVFAFLSLGAVAGAFISRLVVQKDLPE